MKRVLKLNGKQVVAFLISAAVFSMVLIFPTWAAGGAYVSDSYIQIAEGETATISVTADNAAGTYSISTDGPVSASGGGWLENESATISITGTGVGSGSVTITFDDLATFDDEELNGTSLTVEVLVGNPDDGYKGGDKGKEETEEETEAPEEETEEETEAKAEKTKPASKRTVTIDKKQYTLLNDLKGVKIPEGFKTEEKTYQGEKILVLTYGDELVLYVLQRDEDGKVIFREYDEETKAFKVPRTIKQNKIVYYLLDAKAGKAPSEHLMERELTVNDFKVKGYVSDEKALSDLVYLRALAEGKEGIYTFDQTQGSIQRCLTLDPASQQMNSELEAARQEAQKAKKDVKLLKILLIVAAVLIIGLAIVLLLLILRRNKDKEMVDYLYMKTKKGESEDLDEFPEDESELSPESEETNPPAEPADTDPSADSPKAEPSKEDEEEIPGLEFVEEDFKDL